VVSYLTTEVLVSPEEHQALRRLLRVLGLEALKVLSVGELVFLTRLLGPSWWETDLGLTK
jgi:hypothetical protein